jgi:hypothetical protein
VNPLHTEHPELHGLRGNEYYGRIQAIYRSNNKALGLTWDGKFRKFPLRPDLAGLSRQDRKVILNRERRQRRAAIAKKATVKLERHDFIAKLQVTDMLILRTEIDALAASLSQCFHELPPIAKARALELESHLSAIRRRFI